MALNLPDKQKITNNLLLQRFGPEPGQSEKLTQFLANIDFKTAPAEDVHILVAMINSDMTETEEEKETSITKGIDGHGAENFLTSPSSIVGGFVGNDSGTNPIISYSPPQNILNRGMDYKSKYNNLQGEEQKETDFIQRTGTDTNGESIYQANPLLSYLKMILPPELKAKLQTAVLDPRLMERIDTIAMTQSTDPNIAMAQEISTWNKQGKVKLIFKNDPSKSDAANDEDKKEYETKYNQKIKTQDPPYQGTGFSSSGDLTKNQGMNMIPGRRQTEKYLPVQDLKQYNVTVEVHTMFSQTDAKFDPNKPQGSIDVLVASKTHLNGKSTVTVDKNAKDKLSVNYERVRNYMPLNSNRDQLDIDHKMDIDRIEVSLAIRNEPGYEDSLPKRFKKHLKKKGNRVLSKNEKLSSSTRKVNEDEANRKDPYRKRKQQEARRRKQEANDQKEEAQGRKRRQQASE